MADVEAEVAWDSSAAGIDCTVAVGTVAAVVGTVAAGTVAVVAIAVAAAAGFDQTAACSDLASPVAAAFAAASVAA